MSRIGKQSVAIPEGVDAKVSGQKISIKGPKGSLNFDFHDDVEVKVSEKEIRVSAKRNTKQAWSLWGLTRMLIANMIQGVTKGFEKQLELQGVGYRMAVQGKKINLALGFSHPVEVEIPEGLEAKIEKNILTISGIDKQKVGQQAASIRALKKVEPYKGKGFRYVGEIVRKKAGKKAVGAEK
ncbi:MAG: 50S ribosomal protein L6 [Candidatus Moranbacteria bacterium]|nr:50S ribosomal protein L6 [Candidatus Moranbacteria bacterium]